MDTRDPRPNATWIDHAVDMGDGWIQCIDNRKKGYRINAQGEVRRCVVRQDGTFSWTVIDGEYAEMVREATQALRSR